MTTMFLNGAIHSDHLHQAAYRRQHRLNVIDNGLMLTAIGLLAAAFCTGADAFAFSAAGLAMAVWVWRRSARLYRGGLRAANLELAARRAEVVAYCARQAADGIDCPDVPADLCARLDAIEARLPWWTRTT